MITLVPGPLAYGVSLYALAETLDAGATFMTLPAFDADDVLALLKNGVKRLVIMPAMIGALEKSPVHTILFFLFLHKLLPEQQNLSVIISWLHSVCFPMLNLAVLWRFRAWVCHT